MQEAFFGLKLRVLESVVRPTLLWGSHTWTWNHGMATLIRRTHRTMIERMMRNYKKTEETWEAFWTRRGTLINRVMENMHHACWLLSAMILHHRWAGHCIRVQERSWAKRTQDCNSQKHRLAKWAILGGGTVRDPTRGVGGGGPRPGGRTCF